MTGVFFIFGYPGDDDESMMETMRFVSRLPLDYVGIGFSYPIPGTAVYERVKDRLYAGDPKPDPRGLIRHQLTYYSDIPDHKLRFAVMKVGVQFLLRRELGSLSPVLVRPFEAATDAVFRLL